MLFPTHVSVSPTDGNGPTQGQRKTLTRVGIIFLSLCGSHSPFVGDMVSMGRKQRFWIEPSRGNIQLREETVSHWMDDTLWLSL